MKIIYDIAKCTSGNVLVIGKNEKIATILSNNERVTECNILSKNTRQKGKTTRIKKQKQIEIKKIRKIFKKKNVDFILCDNNEIKKYLKYFIKDSVYINKQILYIYNIIDTDELENIKNKYNRYTSKIEEIQDNNTTILKIDNTNTQNNIFKDKIYLISDTISEIIEQLSNIILN